MMKVNNRINHNVHWSPEGKYKNVFIMKLFYICFSRYKLAKYVMYFVSDYMVIGLDRFEIYIMY